MLIVDKDKTNAYIIAAFSYSSRGFVKNAKMFSIGLVKMILILLLFFVVLSFATGEYKLTKESLVAIVQEFVTSGIHANFIAFAIIGVIMIPSIIILTQSFQVYKKLKNGDVKLDDLK